ncbi:MAG TPA: hypothetical protein VHK69_10720, partial [Chitinophagaceae bacterium]|nr:hypothetical protein [Chitinophagaceae bacterium]
MILRDEIIEVVRKEIVGPNEKDEAALQQELLQEVPLSKYISGILEPYCDEMSAEDIHEDGDLTDEDAKGFTAATGTSQSSMGFSFFLGDLPSYELALTVSYGTYTRLEGDTFQRAPHQRTFTVRTDQLGLDRPFRERFHEGHLGILLVQRDPSNRFFDTTGKRLFTLSVSNLQRKEGSQRPSFDECFYQVELKLQVLSGAGILPYPEYDVLQGEDEMNNRLLYRGVRNYSIGHGCSVVWDEAQQVVNELRSTYLPSFDLFPLNHRELAGIDLSMLRFYQDEDNAFTLRTLQHLADQYATWIKENEGRLGSLPDPLLRDQGAKNIVECKKVLARFGEGIALLRKDPQVRLAFRYMTWAMLFQQIRYGLSERPWSIQDGEPFMEDQTMPQVEDPTSWPDHDPKLGRNTRLGKWRPFQIAFVLMNLNALVHTEAKEREVVDLIWFPTGGGKTEAYLGLTAFTLLYNRITQKKQRGTDVLMRYTLRLLTTEQFQRASSLICAAELLRQKANPTLGEQPITIGLWVGSEVTPNNRAVEKLNKMIQEDKPYAFVLLKCPCCGKR